MRKTNEAGVSLIKEFEKCRLEAYKDAVKVWTIGWGHTGPEVGPGLVISQDQADDLLANDLAARESVVESAVTVELTDNQFAALVSFTYNAGAAALRSSSLLRKLNAEDYDGAADEFLKWNKGTIKGKKVVLAGLTRRRKEERALFLTPDDEDESTADTVPLPPVETEAAQQNVEAGGIGVNVATSPPPEPISKPDDTPISITAIEPQKSNAKKSVWATIVAAAGWVALNIQNFFGKAYESVQNNPMLTVSLVVGSITLLVIYWKYQERLERLDARRGQQAHELTLEQMRLAADPHRYPVKVVKE